MAHNHDGPEDDPRLGVFTVPHPPAALFFAPSDADLGLFDTSGAVRLYTFRKRWVENGVFPVTRTSLSAIAFDAKWTRLAVCDADNHVAIHSARNGSTMASSTNSFAVRVLRFTNDGRGLVAAGGDRRNGHLTLFDGRSLDTIRTLRTHQGAITAIAFAPNNRFLATGGEHRQIRLWEWAKILNSP